MQRLRLLLAGLLIFSIQTHNHAEDTAVYGPTESGDILWNIAGKVQTNDSSVTRHQIMVALFRANAQAFRVPCNIHSLLKIGQHLKVPAVAEMHAIPPAEALAFIKQQGKIWQRRRTQPIVCSGSEETAELRPPPDLPSKRSLSESSTGPLKQQGESSSGAYELTFMNSFSLPMPILMGLFAIGGLFFLALFVGWFLRRYIPQTMDDDKLFNFNAKEHSFAKDSLNETEKLNNVRTCLASGDTRTAQTYLNAMIDKGQVNQEIRQLLEITLQMSTLELQVAQSKQLITTQNQLAEQNPAENQKSQELTQPSEPVSISQYLLDDKTKLVEIVNKVVTFLDHELNAQGKLLEACNHLQDKLPLEVEDYQVVGQPPEEADKETLQKQPRERKPTRYL